MQFSIMKSNHFTSLLFIIIAFSNYDFVASQSAPDAFPLRIQTENGKIMNIELQRVESSLLLKNVPIQIIIGGAYIEGIIDEPESFNNVGAKTMAKLGDLTMYHDYCTKSAFVYFHKTQKLNGIVGRRYGIKGLPMNRVNELLKVKSKYLHVFHAKKSVKKWRFGRSNDYNSSRIRSSRQTARSEKSIYYPELLVAISNNMYRALGSDHVKTVAHVVTIYNTVDMLFRLVQSVPIKIHIATIVIETLQHAMAGITYPKYSKNSVAPRGFIGPSVVRRLSVYYKSKYQEFPRDSFDFVAFHTKTPLRNLDGEDVPLITFPARRDFLLPPNRRIYRSSLSVRDSDTYENYMTVAHGLALVFTAEHDDHDARNGDEMNCEVDKAMGESVCPNIQAAHAYCSEWNPQTENDFTEFFKSRAGCNLLNKPRGLYGFQPRKIFTTSEQCQCYGFLTVNIDHENELRSAGKVCESTMECINARSDSKTSPIPMDGSTCGENKVCWAGVCKALD